MLWESSAIQMKIIELSETDSTNEYCKRLDADCDTLVTADRQSAGKGTKGRSFVSSEGGVYISLMRFYNDFPASAAFKIMINSCAAVCETVEKFGLNPVIRWSNDVLVNGKKICGTLIENIVRGGRIIKSIVGIGINVNNTLPPELKHVATTMQAELGKSISVSSVKKTLISKLQKTYDIAVYKRYINWLGKNVVLKTAESETVAEALDIEDDGRLVCNIGGIKKKISSAEVSLRL